MTFNSTIKFTRSHFMSVLSRFVTNEEDCALDFRLPCFPLENQPCIYFHRVHLLAGLPSWEPLCGWCNAVVCWPCTAPASSLQPVGPPARPPTSSFPWPGCNHHLLCSPGPELQFHRFSLWAVTANPWGFFHTPVLSHWNVLRLSSWRLCFRAGRPEKHPNALEGVWTLGGSREGKKHPGVWL